MASTIAAIRCAGSRWSGKKQGRKLVVDPSVEVVVGEDVPPGPFRVGRDLVVVALLAEGIHVLCVDGIVPRRFECGPDSRVDVLVEQEAERHGR
jgi:hypothetical protein